MNNKSRFHKAILLATAISLLYFSNSVVLAAPQSGAVLKLLANVMSMHKHRAIPELIRQTENISPVTKSIQRSFATSKDEILKTGVVIRLGRHSQNGAVAQVVAIAIEQPTVGARKVFLYHYNTHEFVSISYIHYLKIELRDYSELILGIYRAGDIQILKTGNVADLNIDGTKLIGTVYELKGLEQLMMNEMDDVFRIIAEGRPIKNITYKIF